MIQKRYTPILFLLIGFLLLSGCARAELTPIVIRITATPQPQTPTPVPPTPTEAPPTEAPAAEQPTEAPAAEEPTEALAATEVEGVEVKFNFVTPLSTIEELEPVLLAVEEVEGVLTASGTAQNITVTYDPAVTDVETLMDALARTGNPVEEAD